MIKTTDTYYINSTGISDSLPVIEQASLSVVESAIAEKARLKGKNIHLLVAIDGRCASGKTTLARMLEESIECSVIHMDDFFLRPEQRTPERLNTPGGNVDYERFLTEVMEPLPSHQAFSYRPYDCKRQTLGDPISVQPHPIIIIEGAYSCHPALWDAYDLRIFLTVDKKEQRNRILHRNGEAALPDFLAKWIPMEEMYFEEYSIKERCELCLKT